MVGCNAQKTTTPTSQALRPSRSDRSLFDSGWPRPPFSDTRLTNLFSLFVASVLSNSNHRLHFAENFINLTERTLHLRGPRILYVLFRLCACTGATFRSPVYARYDVLSTTRQYQSINANLTYFPFPSDSAPLSLSVFRLLFPLYIPLYRWRSV